METLIGKLLGEAFASAHRDAVTNQRRAEVLDEDPATLSKIMNGRLPLTEARAAKWVSKLFPADPVRAAQFVERVSILPRAKSARSVDDFCQACVSNGGAVPAERIGELFEALQATDHAIVAIEYRDLPRTSPEAKYEELGGGLVAAVAAGVAVAMFQPFGNASNIPLPNATRSTEPTPSLAAATYMRKVSVECRAAFRQYSEQLTNLAPNSCWQSRLRLYERCVDGPCLGSGFQGKMFLVQYHTLDDAKTRHRRILQWLTTPRQDLIVYRGEQHIDPEGLRDTFFPVVHSFEKHGVLPYDVTVALTDLRSSSMKREELPMGDAAFWQVFRDGS